MDIVQDMLTTFNDDPDLHKEVFTGDETWTYGYDIETKAQLFQLKHPEELRPKKARQILSNVKAMLSVFIDFNGVANDEFLPQGCTFNKKYYLEVMHRLCEVIRQKRTELWKN